MGDYNNDNGGSRYGRNSGRGRDFGGRSSDKRNNYGSDDQREMFSAVCDECGNDCEVPFRPTEGKPIYCNKCFRKRNEESESGFGNNRYDNESGPKRSFSRNDNTSADTNKLKEEISSLNAKMDKILALLESADTV